MTGIEPRLRAMQATLRETPHLLRLGRLFSETVLLTVGDEAYYLFFRETRFVNLSYFFASL